MFPPSDYRFFHERSQIYLGPPTWLHPGAKLEQDLTEVYVKNIAARATMEELYNLVIDCGTFYQIRLPITLSQEAKGYAYIRYLTKMDAARAKSMLNGRVLHDLKIEASMSWDTRSIQVLNWPKNLNQEFSQAILMEKLRDVESVRVEMDPRGLRNRGYVVIEFASHNAAAIGRRDLKAGIKHPLLPEDAVYPSSWTRSDFDIPEEEFRDVNMLYVNHIPVGLSKDSLQAAIEQMIGMRPFLKLHHSEGYGFLTFPSHADASRALEILRADPLTIGNENLQFHWVKGKYAKKRTTTPDQAIALPMLQSQRIAFRPRVQRNQLAANAQQAASLQTRRQSWDVIVNRPASPRSDSDDSGLIGLFQQQLRSQQPPLQGASSDQTLCPTWDVLAHQQAPRPSDSINLESFGQVQQQRRGQQEPLQAASSPRAMSPQVGHAWTDVLAKQHVSPQWSSILGQVGDQKKQMGPPAAASSQTLCPIWDVVANQPRTSDFMLRPSVFGQALQQLRSHQQPLESSFFSTPLNQPLQNRRIVPRPGLAITRPVVPTPVQISQLQGTNANSLEATANFSSAQEDTSPTARMQAAQKKDSQDSGYQESGMDNHFSFF